MSKRLLLLPLLLSVTCPAVWAQDPAGAEFPVNSYTTGHQRHPKVASDANRIFVVVWSSETQDGSRYGVFGQRFDASGLPQGAEFRVNNYTTGDQFNPAVASDAAGNFVVVWGSYGQDGTGMGVFGQRFNAAGLPLGSEFQVNTYTTGSQARSAVASDANGNFVVVWQSYDGQDGSSAGVFGQRFNAAGLPQGAEFRVNNYTTGVQFNPAVASDASGNFVVAWGSADQDAGGVFGQRFNAAGLPEGSEFQVNSYTPGLQRSPSVASDASGNFVVVWQSFGQDGNGDGVFGQRFNAAGLRQGTEFEVNTYTARNQYGPRVASAANGNFVVVWGSETQDGSSYGVFGQRFNALGVAQGSEFRVNSDTADLQWWPAVASAPNGNFVVVWESLYQDGSNFGVFGQRYGDLIFKDGFQ